MKKFLVCFSVIIGLLTVKGIFASIADIEQIDGQQRQRIINESGSGSSSEADAFMVTTTNTPTTYGAGITTTNNGTLVTSNMVNRGTFKSSGGSVSFGTNGFDGSYGFLVNGDGFVASSIGFHRGSGDPYYYFGNFLYSGSEYLEILEASSAIDFTPGPGATTGLRFKANGNQLIQLQHASAIRLAARPSGVSFGPIGGNSCIVTNMVRGTISIDCPSLNTLTSFTTNLALTGVRTGAKCHAVVTSSTNTTGIVFKGWSTNDGVLCIDMYNVTAGSVDPQPETLSAIVTIVE